MAAERLSVRKIREVLRLHALGLSRRDIGRSAGISHNTAGLYICRAAEAGLTPAAMEALDDAELEARLLPALPSGRPRPVPEWPAVHRELGRKGARSSCCGRSTSTRIRMGTNTRSTCRATVHGRAHSTRCCARSTVQGKRPSSIMGATPSPSSMHRREKSARRSFSSASSARATSRTRSSPRLRLCRTGSAPMCGCMRTSMASPNSPCRIMWRVT
jgi:hypothetical protein